MALHWDISKVKDFDSLYTKGTWKNDFEFTPHEDGKETRLNVRTDVLILLTMNVGIGQITETCVPDNGNIMVRKLMNMTLSVDHKVANGAYAAQFLDFVRKQLEDTSTFDPKS